MKEKFSVKKLYWLYAVGIISVITTAFTYTIQYNNTDEDKYFEISKNMEIFSSVYKNISLFYVDEVEPGELMKVGIDAMLKSLDPYTNYIPESDIEDYRFMTTGQYGGIGALIRKEDEYVIISEPYEGFPAEKAGIIAGDMIMAIDGKSIEGKSSSEVSDFLKGQSGTEVKLSIKRGNGEEFTKTLVREEIKIPDVPYFGMLDDKSGYIKLTSFTQTASSEVRKAFMDLKEQGMENLVFDLRGNGGGLLFEAVNIVNFFVPKGSEIVSTKGRVKDMNHVYYGENQPIDLEIPIVVLVDGNSASASEIVSGALQDLDRAVIVGRRTYGKGLVQQTKNLDYNSKIKLTIAKYYIPSGRCIQKINYSDRVEGNGPSEIPDSLLKAFTTKNGRKVIDGRGIDPDVLIEQYQYSPITKGLFGSNLIFDFATDFRLKNESIKNAKEFSIEDNIYNSFKDFVLKQDDFKYSTTSEKMLDNVIQMAKEEKYYEESKDEFEALIEELTPDTKEDLEKFSAEIKEILENEIVSRYYYQTGRVQTSLKDDPYILKAQELFGEEEEYEKILSPKN